MALGLIRSTLNFTGRVARAALARQQERVEDQVAAIVTRALDTIGLDVKVTNPRPRRGRASTDVAAAPAADESGGAGERRPGATASSAGEASDASGRAAAGPDVTEVEARRGPRGPREAALSTAGGVASTVGGLTATVGGLTSTVAGVASTVGSVAGAASGSARGVPGIGPLLGGALGKVGDASSAVGDRAASVGELASRIGGVGSLIGSSLGRPPERSPARRSIPQKSRVIRRRPLARPKSTLDMMRKTNRPRPRSYADLEARQVAGIEPHEILMKVASYQLGQMLLGVLQRSAQAQLDATNAAKSKLTQRQIMLLSRLPMAMLEQILPPQLALPPATSSGEQPAKGAATEDAPAGRSSQPSPAAEGAKTQKRRPRPAPGSSFRY